MADLPARMEPIAARLTGAVARAASWIGSALGVGDSGGVSLIAGAMSWASPTWTAALGQRFFREDPWFFAATTVKAQELSGLPLYAVRVLDDGTERRIPRSEEPRLLRLIRAAKPSQRSFREQVLADAEMCGVAYVWDRGTELRRLNPARVTVQASDTDQFGEPTRYRWSDARGQQVEIAASAMIVISRISGSSEQSSTIGTAPTAALAPGILTASEVKRLAAKQGANGGVRQIISVGGSIGNTPQQKEGILKRFEEKARRGDEYAVLDGDVKVFPAGTPIKEMDFPGIHETSRGEVAGALRVPGTKLGILDASYGQSRQEERAFQEGLRKGPGAAFEDAFSSRIDDLPGVQIRHDWSQVEAVQAAQLDRVDAVKKLIDCGVSQTAALTYCGFVELADDVVAPASSTGSGSGGEAKPVEPRRDASILDRLRFVAAHPDLSATAWQLEAIDRGLPLAAAAALADELAAEEHAALDAARDRAADHGRELSADDLAALPIYSEARAARILARMEP